MIASNRWRPWSLAVFAFVGLALFSPAESWAGRSSAKIFVKITADDSRQARAAATVFTARLSCIPGIGLLEGLNNKELAQELELSKSGLVSGATKLEDRTLKPDVTVMFSSTDTKATDHFVGNVKVEGKGGDVMIPVTSELSFALPGGVRMQLLDGIAKSLDKDTLSVWAGTCFGGTPRLDDLASGACATAFECVCHGAKDGPFDEVGCIGALARDVVKRNKGMMLAQDQYVDFTPAEQRIWERVQAKDKTVHSDKSIQATMLKMNEKMMKFDADLKKAMEAFRGSILGVLETKLTIPVPLPGVAPFDADGMTMEEVTLTGFRFKKMDRQPYAELDLKFTATTPREERDVFGTIHHFDKVLRSFEMVGAVQDGKPYVYRLLVGKQMQNGGTIKTSITIERLSTTNSYSFQKVDRGNVRID